MSERAVAAVDRRIDRASLAWGFLSFVLWGLFPLYWKLLKDRPATEVLAHRFIWSFPFYAVLFAVSSRQSIFSVFRHPKRDWLLATLATAFLAINWGLYIYAVMAGRILESSLAYFINPLLNVVVGVVFFGERFPLTLKLATGFAAIGVCLKIALSSTFPTVALILAFSFCAYGVIKKSLKIPAAASSVMEGFIGLLPALAWLVYLQVGATGTGVNSIGSAQPITASTWALFVGAGVITGLPLFLFSFAAQRVPLTLIGPMQFISPSLQFLVGALVYHEPFGTNQLIAFAFIWFGILFYIANQLRNLKFPSK